ncbi:MAG TPA: SDR family NAD(P)-dependent oxidoreductase [Acidimicrobiales bacterium]
MTVATTLSSFDAARPAAGARDQQDLIVVADPCGQSNPSLVVAALRAGALGVLDLTGSGALGLDVDEVTAAIASVTRRTDRAFAVRLRHAALVARPQHGRARAPASPKELGLPDQVTTVILTGPPPSPATIAGIGPVTAGWGGRRVLWEVVSREEAVSAIRAGAAGVVAKGCESGGRVGEVESFVLAQQAAQLGIPFWVQGGVGERTAAAAIAGGAVGVLLDGQLSLVRESRLDEDTRAAVAAMDGSETRVVGHHRFYLRPDLSSAKLAGDTQTDEVAEQLGPDLAHDLVPLGQDAACATSLAERYRTAGGVIQAIAAAIHDQLAAAAEHQPLAPGCGVSSTNGTRYPVVQGPMTRVSDRAEMALAVAEAGGLPFIALALLSGPETRRLLTETAALLGDRPWGVGVLGFVPADVRAAQLEVIHDVRPPAALIAGGRPAQAEPLETAGITTYLHVPSPGLLDRFLRDGARRFVFEGRECGGHVGPRASLPLWEAQIERLLQHDEPTELDILFAGGVHDARSAAMVSAIAAPLAARGARIGVLMGTAYLFTAEAVTSGAITPTFQAVAQDCESTVLLETAPGHATRCVETDYARAFAARKAELETAGVPAKEMWAELEALNLGRLRVASKGLSRHGDQLIELDEPAQRRDGMYMIGQVATLRRELTTIATLHHEVTAGATERLVADTAETIAHRISVREPAGPIDVAVIGMAALFPGAADTEQFWANIVSGVDNVTEVPRDRWNPDTFYAPDAVSRNAGRKTPSKWGGFLPTIPFDPLAYGIPPRSLAAIESVQLLSLEIAARALADAGYDQRPFDRARAAVIFGAENGNDLGGAYGFRAAYPHFVGPLPPELDDHLPAPTEDSFPGVLTNVIAGRIANRLDLGSVNYTVDAACAASLAALDVACKELTGGTSDLVLCGAADVHNGINDYLLFASVHALSPSGRCRTFDANADGIALGEGIACVVLKRLADAERDGDRIYAVIEGIAGSSDGRHLGLTAPRQEGQMRAVTRAYRRAGQTPASVGMVEAHGTGTVVGDRTELATLTDVFAEDGAAPGATVLGSVKSQIGHTKCAAGLAGLIKTARALHAGVLPPTLHIEAPNPYFEAAVSPFRFLDRPLPWPAAERRAGVSAFGFGGTNFHAVLRSHPDDERPEHGVAVWPVELFLLRAASVEAGQGRLRDLHDTVARILTDDANGERHRLRDLAFTASTEASPEPVQWAIVAESLVDLEVKLAAALAGSSHEGVFQAGPDRIAGPGTDGRIAFLYPGQGSQRPGMLADLLVAFPQLQSVLGFADPALVATMYPGAAFDSASRAAQLDAITDTRAAQPALGLAGLAMTRLLDDLAIGPDMTAGHSYGELVALCVAGAFDEAALVELSTARARAMLDAAAAAGGDPGAMAAVGLPADALRRRLGRGVVVANDNGPRQAVAAGPTAAIDALVAELSAEKISAKRLNVAAAFHSPQVAQGAEALGRHLQDRAVGVPSVPVWSNATASVYPNDADGVRARLAAQLRQPVRFVEQIEAMYAAGARVFVEVGPGRVLTQLVGRILGDRDHLAVATDAPGEHGIRRLLLALAELATRTTTTLDVGRLFTGRAQRLDLRSLPVAAPGWRLNGHLVCTHDGEPVTDGLQPADRIPEVTTMEPGQPTPVQETAVLEYLRSLQHIVDAQRDVMLSFLGERAAQLDLAGTGPVGVASTALSTLPTVTLPQANGNGALSSNGNHSNGNGVHPISGNGNGHEPAGDHLPVVTEIVAHDHGPVDASATRLAGAELLAAIVGVVADRTGYPVAMLDPDLDLEADLSIDSIKRIEIIGELADQVGLPGVEDGAIDEAVVEELAQLKTLRAIVAWIDERSPETALAAPAVVPEGAITVVEPDPVFAVVSPETAAGSGLTTRRFVLETETLAPALPVASLAGQRVAVVSDPWDGLDELCRRLIQAGGEVEVFPIHRGAPRVALPDVVAVRVAEVDVIVHLGAVDPVAPVDARDVFASLKPAITGRATTLVAAVAPVLDTSSTAVSGVPGLIRSVARELPDHHVRVVEVPAGQPAKVLARLLADEILDPAGPASIAYRNGVRTTRRVVKGMPLSADIPALPLNGGSVVVVTGGARGITAQAALALAEHTGCRLELLGRSPLPGEEHPRTAAATDRLALRRVLVEAGELRTPGEIEAACGRILAGREIRSTLSALRQLGTAATYHSVDVRDAAALRQVLADIRARHGRIDAVVHGAGVLDDRLARDKTDESFDRVFATKVDAARTILDDLDADTRLVVFFGSVSGVFGNRGQVDYSAANAALDELAVRFDGSGGRRVVSVDWGPWGAAAGVVGGLGMVSPELEREYARRGVGLIDPVEGVRALLNEMATLPGEPAQVVVMRAEPEALECRLPTAPGTFAVSVDLEPHDDEPLLTLEDLTERG